MGEATWESREIPPGNNLIISCSVYWVHGIPKGQRLHLWSTWHNAWHQEVLSRYMLNRWMNWWTREWVLDCHRSLLSSHVFLVPPLISQEGAELGLYSWDPVQERNAEWVGAVKSTYPSLRVSTSVFFLCFSSFKITFNWNVTLIHYLSLFHTIPLSKVGGITREIGINIANYNSQLIYSVYCVLVSVSNFLSI